MFRQRICSISSKLNTHQHQQQLGSQLQLQRCQMNIQKKIWIPQRRCHPRFEAKKKMVDPPQKTFNGFIRTWGGWSSGTFIHVERPGSNPVSKAG